MGMSVKTMVIVTASSMDVRTLNLQTLIMESFLSEGPVFLISLPTSHSCSMLTIPMLGGLLGTASNKGCCGCCS